MEWTETLKRTVDYLEEHLLEDGAAVGIGTHEALLESCQVYREIYESQFEKGGGEHGQKG